MKYEVTVTVKGLIVEADSPEAARLEALDMIGDHRDLGEAKSAEVTQVRPAK